MEATAAKCFDVSEDASRTRIQELMAKS